MNAMKKLSIHRATRTVCYGCNKNPRPIVWTMVANTAGAGSWRGMGRSQVCISVTCSTLKDGDSNRTPTS